MNVCLIWLLGVQLISLFRNVWLAMIDLCLWGPTSSFICLLQKCLLPSLTVQKSHPCLAVSTGWNSGASSHILPGPHALRLLPSKPVWEAACASGHLSTLVQEITHFWRGSGSLAAEWLPKWWKYSWKQPLLAALPFAQSNAQSKCFCFLQRHCCALRVCSTLSSGSWRAA